jgi:ribosomal-protein-alanine N-acetyltransferase
MKGVRQFRFAADPPQESGGNRSGESPKVITAFQERDGRHVGQGCREARSHPPVVICLQSQLCQRVVAVGVVSGADQQPIGVELSKDRFHDPLPCLSVDVACGPGRDGKIDRGSSRCFAPHLLQPPFVGIKRVLVNTHVKHPGIRPKRRLGAVAMMNVPVNNRDSIPICPESGRGHGDVVEQAESHRSIHGGVMARWSKCQKGEAHGLVVTKHFDRPGPCSGCAQSCLPTVRTGNRVVIEMTSATTAEALDRVDVSRRVDPVKPGALGTLRFQRLDRDSAFLNPGLNGLEPSHPLGVKRTCVVMGKARVRYIEDVCIRRASHLLTLPQVSLIGRTERLHRTGDWPGRIELTSGWAKAVARPWNDDVDAVSLRLERGGVRFLRACAQVCTGWSSEVLSPATLPTGVRLWKDAGFVEDNRLLLLEHDLSHKVTPRHEVEQGGLEPLDEILAIDQVCFEPRWRLGRIGLAESVAATGKATVLRIRNSDGTIGGFAICGTSLGTGYLQRLAVSPDSRSRGLGGSLVAASIRWARRAYARVLLVNTQTNNDPAATLYRRFGFADVPGGLLLLRYRPED